jgi:L-cystine transport system permease protein
MTNFFEFSRLLDGAKSITPYLGVTFQIVLVALLCGSLLGLVVAAIRMQRIPLVHQIVGIYISYMRGTPMIVQLMLLYYGFPALLKNLLGIDINGWDKLIFVELAFILNEGAFLGEIFRSSIEAVPSHQSEAGYSVGLSRLQTFYRIVLPQAAKIALPAYGVDVIGVFHNTSIAFTLGVLDMVGRAQTLGANGHQLEPYLYVAFVYVIISILLQLLFHVWSKKMDFGRSDRIHGHSFG